MFKIESRDINDASVVTLTMANNSSPERDYRAFITAIEKFGEFYAAKAQSSGIEITTGDVLKKIASDVIEKSEQSQGQSVLIKV